MSKSPEHVSSVKHETDSASNRTIETLEAETKLSSIFKLPNRSGSSKITIRSPHTGEPIIFKHERAGSSEDTLNSSSSQSDAEKISSVDTFYAQNEGADAAARHEVIAQRTDKLNEEKANTDVDSLSKARAMIDKHGGGEISVEDMRNCVTMLYNMQDDLERRKTKLQEETSKTDTLLGRVRDDSGTIAELLSSLSTKQDALDNEDRSFEREVEILDEEYNQEKSRLSKTHSKRREELEDDLKTLRGRLNSEIAWALDTLVAHSPGQSG